MNTPKETLNDQDPDYVSTVPNDQFQRKIYEENARNITSRKITAIVEKEFAREIDTKEKEILQIQERLHKALKIFHLLRYVIITNFYNRKQCQVSQTAETTKQTRIHPAIKSLLGKCPKSVHCKDLAVPSTSTDPRFSYNDDEPSVSGLNIAAFSKEENKVDKCDGVSRREKRVIPNEESRPRKVPRYIPPKSSAPEKTCPSRGNSRKIRKRVIVGNTSKWIAPDWREDSSSHKWTMYVRGDKDENANISTFVSKVRFFLHPSYRPNDVVEVTSYPFHLSRRGWGEFPLRVQLHFKNVLNKPMDIIHHLKLDRTYTGLRTFGSETLVDMWIHAMEYRDIEQNDSIEPTVKAEPSDRDDFDFACKQFTGSSPAKISRLTAETLGAISVKREISNSSVYILPEPMLLDSALTETLENEVKVESNVTTLSYVNDKKVFDLEEIRRRVEQDHNYSGTQYCKSHHSIIREGNVTTQHFWEDDGVLTTSRQLTATIDNSNDERPDVAIASHKLNGDIQSCSTRATADVSQAVSVNTAFRDISASLKNPLSFDTNNSPQARNPNSENSDVCEIMKNITDRDDTPTTINGFFKTLADSNLDSNLDRFDSLQMTATSSSTRSSHHLKPLQITIPSSNIFTSPTSKHVLVLKNNKSIPMNLTNVFPSKSNQDSRPIDGNVGKLNIRIAQGVSILKKPPSVKVNARQNTTSNKNAVLTVKCANGLLLNVNEDVPILKIADSRYNYNFTDATGNLSSIDKREIAPCARPEDKALVQRAKITLGKDKYKIQSKREVYEAILRSIDIADIVDTEALIRFIIRRLPIVTRDAYDPEYKRMHPYACCSEEEYLAHNVGKQRALEWYRAKMIRHFLQVKRIPIDRLWSIKEIILWARLHGYTPIRDIAFGAPEAVAISDARGERLSTVLSIPRSVPSTYTEPIALQEWLRQTHQRESNRQPTDGCVEDEEIDIENIEDNLYKTRVNGNSDSSNSMLIPLELDKSLLPFHNFVCNTARDIGIKIGPEEIVPGVLHCVASRIIMRVIECFVEDLTRSSLARAWERNNGNGYPKTITLDDVRNALTSREEFNIFINQGLGSKQQFSTTELSSL